MRHITNLVSLVIITFLLLLQTSCKKDSGDGNSMYVKNDSVKSNVAVLKPEMAKLISDSAQESKGTFVFKYSSAPSTFSVGDVIVGSQDNGYLRKIKSISVTGNTVTLQTEQATFEDIYKKASVDFSLNLDKPKSSLNKIYEYGETKINYVLPGVKLSGDGFSYDFSNTVLYQKNPLTFTITSGKVSFNPNWMFHLDISDAKVKEFSFYADDANLKVDCNLSLSAEAKLNLVSYKRTLIDYDKIFTVWVGMVPIVAVINTKLIASLDANLSDKITVKSGIVNDYQISLGCKYQNGSWTQVEDITPSLTVKPVTLNGNVNISQKLVVAPQISVKLYNVLGPYCNANVWERFDATVASPSLDWDASFKVGIDAEVGISNNIPVIGKYLPGYQKTLFDISEELWSAPKNIVKISGDYQEGRSGKALAIPIKVQITDNLEKPLSKVQVYFNVKQGGGSCDKTVVMTDANGYASVNWTLGAQNGVHLLEVKVKKANGTDIESSPVMFTAEVVPNSVSVTTNSASNIKSTSATCSGTVTTTGDVTVTDRGVCWNTTGSPTISYNKTSDGAGTGTFTSSLSKLTPGTTYYVRAYAVSSMGTFYGKVVNFTTTTDLTVTTNIPTAITTTSATCGGTVSSTSSITVTGRGVCWNTSGSPTISNSKTSNGSGTGSFTSSITGLTANTKYYVRAYAIIGSGTVYGNEVSFTAVNSGGTNTVTINFDGQVINLPVSTYCSTCGISSGIAALPSQGYYPSLGIIFNFTTAKTYNLNQTCSDNIHDEIAVIIDPAVPTAYYNTYNSNCNGSTKMNHNGTITITSITSKTIKGTFSATLYLNSDFSKPKAISGSFDITN